MTLQFFSNTTGGYGSAVPYTRVVEPSSLGMFLNLEQNELLRIQRYNEAWRFYFGKHWEFKRDEGEPLVTFNYIRKIVDKSTEFLVSKGFVTRVEDCLSEVTKPFIDEVWEYNRGQQLIWDMGTNGGVTGDVFVLVTFEEPTVMQKRINPYSEGKIRVNLLGSEQVFPTWDPIDTNKLVSVRIETIYYSERGDNIGNESRVNHEGRQLYTKRFTQIITPTKIIEQFHGEQPKVRVNALGEIPLVHIKNFSVPKEYYGLSDTQDLIDVQREINEKSTDISDVINYHAAPVTIIYGAKAKALQKGPNQIWSGLPKDAKVDTLKLEGDLVASTAWVQTVKKTLHELSDVPEGSLGAMQPISNTSGTALNMMFMPLVGKTKRKKDQYEPGIQDINYFILRIGMTQGQINLPFDMCKHCGGRIIEVGTGETTMVWSAERQTYEEVPVMAKRCYHVDKQTLEFTDPMKMRLKWWRQYGFGAEVREMQLKDIHAEITDPKRQRSFWDYTPLQEQALEAWREQNAALIQSSHDSQVSNATPPATPPNPDGSPGEAQPHIPPASQALIPQAEVAPPKIKPPPALQTMRLPDGEIEVPEEPENVEITMLYRHPETGDVVASRTVTKLLVPTGCERPQYLNPFGSTVEFLDPLPKDEHLQAQLYQVYQQNEWVDAEWVRGKIPEIAPDADELAKRMKNREAAQNRMQPVMETQGAGMRQTTYQELAPPPGDPAALPGPGGNPTSPTQQLGA